MLTKRIVTAAVATFLILLTLFFILQANSLTIALKQADLNTGTVTYIEELDSDNGTLYKVLKTTSDTGALALVRMYRSNLGFWKVEDIELSNSEKGYDFVSLAWMKHASIRRFSFQDTPDFEREWHYVYCGNNAIKEIEPLAEFLPRNVTVNVQQAGESYLIHIITYANPDETGTIDMYTILKQNGFVKTDTDT